MKKVKVKSYILKAKKIFIIVYLFRYKNWLRSLSQNDIPDNKFDNGKVYDNPKKDYEIKGGKGYVIENEIFGNILFEGELLH